MCTDVMPVEFLVAGLSAPLQAPGQIQARAKPQGTDNEVPRDKVHHVSLHVQ